MLSIRLVPVLGKQPFSVATTDVACPTECAPVDTVLWQSNVILSCTADESVFWAGEDELQVRILRYVPRVVYLAFLADPTMVYLQ